MAQKKNRMRSIDPPMLPAWAEEMTDSGKQGPAKEDPAALAKRLAKEAKAKLAKGNGKAKEDPAALAKRLAKEAKARLANKPKPEPKAAAPKKKAPKKKRSLADRAINPRALAAKLAAEAKADLEKKRQKNLAKLEKKAKAENQDAVSTLESPVAEPEKAPKAKAKAKPAPIRAPKARAKPKKRAAPQPRKSLRDRAQPKKKMSAAEALAAAMAAEAVAEPKKKAPQRAKAAAAAAPAPAPAAQAAPAPAPTPVASTPGRVVATSPAADPVAVIAGLLPGATIETPISVSNAAVFRALWQAHRARALHDKDYSRVATASVLLDAIDRVPAGQLAAAKVTIDDSTWAVWVDASRGTLLGVAAPAEVYMAGL